MLNILIFRYIARRLLTTLEHLTGTPHFVNLRTPVFSETRPLANGAAPTESPEPRATNHSPVRHESGNSDDDAYGPSYASDRYESTVVAEA